MGPYEIKIIYHNGYVNICTIDKVQMLLMDNGHHMQLYQKSLSNKSFLRDIGTHPNLEVDVRLVCCRIISSETCCR